MSSKQTIEERVKILIADKLGVELEEVVNDAELADQLGADSLDSVEIIMELEKEFDIEIKDELAENLKTVDDHVKIVEQLFAESKDVDLTNENVGERV
jgi:acyl carrier protein